MAGLFGSTVTDIEKRQALRQADDAPRGEREEPPPPWLQ